MLTKRNKFTKGALSYRMDNDTPEEDDSYIIPFTEEEIDSGLMAFLDVSQNKAQVLMLYHLNKETGSIARSGDGKLFVEEIFENSRKHGISKVRSAAAFIKVKLASHT